MSRRGLLFARVTTSATVAATSLLASMLLGHLAAQTPVGSDVAFEAVSIKVRTGDGPGPVEAPDRYAQSNATFRNLVLDAFHLQPFQVIDIPQALLAPLRFDVAAKAAFVPTKQQMEAMLQRMLAERFALAAHREKRDQSVYRLRMDRSDRRFGKQLAKTAVDCDEVKAQSFAPGAPPLSLRPDGSPICAVRMVAMPSAAGMTLRYRASGVTAGDLADWLTGYVRRMVIDETGITGQLDVDLSFDPTIALNPSPDAQTQTAAPSVFTALTEQLGLKLESATAPVDVLVIDHAERPTPD